jgi:hypothetical protein
VSGLQAPAPGVNRRHRPETTALYEVVRDNLETLYGAIGDGALHRSQGPVAACEAPGPDTQQVLEVLLGEPEQR